MKSLVKGAVVFLLTVWAGGAIALAQTNASAPAPKPPITTRPRSQRYSGKIERVDGVAKTIILQGAAKEQIQVTSQTRIVKNKEPATFDDLAAGQAVTGMKRVDAAGKSTALTLHVGDPRQIRTGPAPKKE